MITDQPRCILCGKDKRQEELKGYNSLAPVGMQFESAYCKNAAECEDFQSKSTTSDSAIFNQRFYDQDILDKMHSKVINWEIPSGEEATVLYRTSDFDIRQFTFHLYNWLQGCERPKRDVRMHVREICYRIGK